MLKTNIYFSAGGGLRVWGEGAGAEAGAGVRPTDSYTFMKPGT